MSEILVRNVKLENNKCDQRAFENYNEQMEKRMIFIENTFDKLNDKNKALENWIDIYMPLRI